MAEILNPAPNHHKDKRENGSTQHIHPTKIDPSLDGVFTAAIRNAEQTANGEIEPQVARTVAQSLDTAVGAQKAQLGLLRLLGNQKNLSAEVLNVVRRQLGLPPSHLQIEGQKKEKDETTTN